MASATLYANQTATVKAYTSEKGSYGQQIAAAYRAKCGDLAQNDPVILIAFNNTALPKGAIVEDVTAKLYQKIESQGIAARCFLMTGPLRNQFSQQDVSWNSASPLYEGGYTFGKELSTPLPGGFAWAELAAEGKKQSALQAVKNGLFVWTEISKDNFSRPDQPGTLSIYSASSSSRPQLIVQYNAPSVSVSPGFADGFFVPKRESRTISWAVNWQASETMFLSPQQTKATIQCKDSAGSKTITVTGDAKTASIPAGTFTQDTGQIKITVDTTAGGHAESSWINVNTVDEVGTAIAESPRGVRVDGDQPVEMRWSYENPTGTAQTKAELQVSYDGAGSWQELAQVTGASTSTTLAPGKLQTGAAAWRVRCFNSDNKPGEYSEPAYIIVSRRPKPPSYLQAAWSPRMVIQWDSSGQQGFEVEVFQAEQPIYQSGTLFGTHKRFALPFFLPDGEYTVQVRIVDTQGQYSEWTRTGVQIHNNEADPIQLTVRQILYGVRLEWTASTSECDGFYILRDGVPIARTSVETTAYTDENANGPHLYTVRGLYGGGLYYTDSNAVEGVTTVRYGAIRPLEGGEWMLLKLHEGGPFVHNESRARQVEYVQYAGHTLPTAYPAGSASNVHTIEYTLRTQQQWRQIKQLEGREVLYKDYRGALVAGMLDSVEASHTRRVGISLSITETDWTEQVRYEDVEGAYTP